MARIRYVAIGDSFTEGVGDEQPDGSVRGWADLVAQGLADATGEPIDYANLAIRGRLLGPILAEQLEPAIALGPTLLSFNGGGNDMLRPGTDMASIIAATEGALFRIQQAGIEPLLLAGANPTGGLPNGGSVSRKGSELTRAAGAVAERLGIRFSDNWSDPRARAQPVLVAGPPPPRARRAPQGRGERAARARALRAGRLGRHRGPARDPDRARPCGTRGNTYSRRSGAGSRAGQAATAAPPNTRRS